MKFRNQKVTAFAGIGNPINFFNLLKENNIDSCRRNKIS